MIKTLLIEDEPHSRDFIKQLIKDTAPFIELVAETGYVDEAVTLIKEKQPELVIVDIQLYGRTAFDIFKEFNPIDFQLVFITAFEHFAIPAIKLSAVDYILKPVSPTEFKEAMEKVRNRFGIAATTPPAHTEKDYQQKTDKLIISDYKEIYIIKKEDIIYFKADGNYTHVVLNNGKKITTAKPISEFEDMLSANEFYRIHKSYLINMSQIVKYVKGRGGEVVMANGDTVYVSSRKKDEFLELIKN